MKIFWDIESYRNLFCAGFLDDNDFLEMFYIVNNEEDRDQVRKACAVSKYKFKMYDLTKDASRLMYHFEKRIPREENSILSEFLGLTDKEIKPKEDWYIGYNTLGYDIQMIDYLLKSVLANRVQTTTETLRKFSDTLINDTARRVNTKDYEMYANQVDAAFLNETMIESNRPTIGLKTLVGTKGGSIIESESNKTGYSNDIFYDVLYNINDISELRDVVFPGKMALTFDVRKSLLERYPTLKENKITVNSTSAKFVEFIVSPYEPIDDIPTVSYMYPAKHICEKLGVEQKDMLEYAKDWYMENVFKSVYKHNPAAAKKHLTKFMSIYEYYDNFRGKNWNDSMRHLMKYQIQPEPKANRRKLLDDYGVFIPFIDKYGNDSYTYANFSSGGIHGAEIFYAQLEQDRRKIAELREKYVYISRIPSGEVSQALLNLIKAQSRTQYKDYPVSLSHEIPKFMKLTEQVDEILDPNEFTPYMYNSTKKCEDIIERYKYTSTGMSVHQDFAGYYPMRATRFVVKSYNHI